MRGIRLQLTLPGLVMLSSAGALVAVGLASIYVTDTHYAAGHDGPANAAKQCVRVMISLGVALFVLRIGYHRMSGYAYPLLIAVTGPLVGLGRLAGWC